MEKYILHRWNRWIRAKIIFPIYKNLKEKDDVLFKITVNFAENRKQTWQEPSKNRRDKR